MCVINLGLRIQCTYSLAGIDVGLKPLSLSEVGHRGIFPIRTLVLCLCELIEIQRGETYLRHGKLLLLCVKT